MSGAYPGGVTQASFDRDMDETINRGAITKADPRAIERLRCTLARVDRIQAAAALIEFAEFRLGPLAHAQKSDLLFDNFAGIHVDEVEAAILSAEKGQHGAANVG
ncbi:MAG: hypothetical protein ACLPWF_04675 [Bryobacteraceae bacterium]|jgi:hypothetical protein